MRWKQRRPGCYRAEDLFIHYRHIRGDICEDSGLKEIRAYVPKMGCQLKSLESCRALPRGK